MTEKEKRKGGGGKLSRSETVTVRLDPKLRYLTELAARKHRRTLSSYMEWRIRESLESEDVRPVNTPAPASAPETIGTEAEYLWDVDEADRFAKLALRYPHLLTHEEQVRWKFIRECPGLWRRHHVGDPETWAWIVDEGSMLFGRLRSNWDALCAVADGRASVDILPGWVTTTPQTSGYGGPPPPSPPKQSTSFDETDDDIPI